MVGLAVLSGVGIVDITAGLVVLSMSVVVVCVFASVPLPSSEKAVVAGVVFALFIMITKFFLLESITLQV